MRGVKSFFSWLFRSRFRRWLIIYLPVCCLIFTITCNFLVEQNAKGRIYTDVNDVPSVSAALLPGTTFSIKGKPNLFFKYRIEAAVALWNAGKVKYIIVSGDNSTQYYDETTAMKKSLVEHGVPDSVIVMDYAGFRTLDSVVRAFWVFGQKDIVIVSQEFQNERGIYIADHFGINAVGFNAQDVSRNSGWKTHLREYFARVAAVLDVHILGTIPKYPGPPEPIGLRQDAR